MYCLIPGIDNFNTDSNILVKMFPLNFSSSQFDFERSCCVKSNSGYCNLKILSFDRNLVFTIDKWIVELAECVFFKKQTTKFPTSHFEKQMLTDFFSILLYIVDLFLADKKLNISFKEKLFTKYKNFFNYRQQYLLVQILVHLWIEKDNEQMWIIKRELEERQDIQSLYSLIDFFTEFEKKDLVLHGYLQSLYKKFKSDTLNVDDVVEMKVLEESFIVVPMQNVENKKWTVTTSGISKYSTKIFVDSLEKFKRCSRNKSKPPIVFAFSFQKHCRLFYCIYNECEFKFNSDSAQFSQWCRNMLNMKTVNLRLNNVKSFGGSSSSGDEEKIRIQQCEFNKLVHNQIPLYPNMCLQDLFILMEMYILRRKYKHFLNKNAKLMDNELELNLRVMSIINWPFNNKAKKTPRY